MKSFFVTGATGNVGLEVIRALDQVSHPYTVFAGVRNPGNDAAKFTGYDVSLRAFDFADAATHAGALQGIDVLFLLRPPQLADVGKYFLPLINTAVAAGVQHVIFLSVQGVEDSRFIPHHKIEALLRQSGLAYTFLRPAYFMQNFTTTLHKDLAVHRRIFLPAGKARFTLVDVNDIGRVTAHLLGDLHDHRNKAYDLTSNDLLSFGEMAAVIGRVTGKPVRYESPNLLRFFLQKRREGMAPAFILVLIMLHYLPRFKKEPSLSNSVEKITGRPPVSFAEFVQQHARLLQ